MELLGLSDGSIVGLIFVSISGSISGHPDSGYFLFSFNPNRISGIICEITILIWPEMSAIHYFSGKMEKW